MPGREVRLALGANDDITGMRRDPWADPLMARLDAEGKAPTQKAR